MGSLSDSQMILPSTSMGTRSGVKSMGAGVLRAYALTRRTSASTVSSIRDDAVSGGGGGAGGGGGGGGGGDGGRGASQGSARADLRFLGTGVDEPAFDFFAISRPSDYFRLGRIISDLLGSFVSHIRVFADFRPYMPRAFSWCRGTCAIAILRGLQPYDVSMNKVLALCSAMPELPVPAGHRLIEEGVAAGRMYVLKSGAFDVVRDGVRVVSITEPGAFLGEISVLLGSTPIADVVATRDSTVHVLQDAAAGLHRNPELTFAVAQLLARRLQAVTSYLVDIKRQYADTDTHLGLMDQVLANLMAMQPPGGLRPGSERGDVPDY